VAEGAWNTSAGSARSRTQAELWLGQRCGAARRPAVWHPRSQRSHAVNKIQIQLTTRASRLIVTCSVETEPDPVSLPSGTSDGLGSRPPLLNNNRRGSGKLVPPEDREVREQCDGCGEWCPVPELGPIGDGLIQACRACHGRAVAMVRTKAETSIVPTHLMAVGRKIVCQSAN
jgi:hypothetical protein